MFEVTKNCDFFHRSLGVHSEHPYYHYISFEIPNFALFFQNFEPYFIPTFLMEGTWKPVQ